MEEKKYYTVREVAELLTLSEGTIRNKISRGEIKAVKIYDATRIPKEEIKKNTKPL